MRERMQAMRQTQKRDAENICGKLKGLRYREDTGGCQFDARRVCLKDQPFRTYNPVRFPSPPSWIPEPRIESGGRI